MPESIAWQSVQWSDGSKYEGLVKDDLCHVRGVFNYAGGDRYMGEYLNNDMEGYGVYVWKDGTIYRGQWENSMMNGCGVKLTKQPNGQILAEEGEFVNDEWVGNVMGCSVAEARRAAAQADTAAQMASAFESKNSPPARSDSSQKRSVPLLHSRKPGDKVHPLKFIQKFVDDSVSKIQSIPKSLPFLQNK